MLQSSGQSIETARRFALAAALLALAACGASDEAPVRTAEPEAPAAAPSLVWTWPAGSEANAWTLVTPGAVETPAAGGLGIRSPETPEAPDVFIRSPELTIRGADFPRILIELECAEACVEDEARIDLALYYTTPSHGETIDFFNMPQDRSPMRAGERRRLVYDMTRLSQGGAAWTESLISRIRFDLPQGRSAYHVVHEIRLCNETDATCR